MEDFKAICANVSEHCGDELINSMAACVPPNDPSKAAQHLISGLEQLGDVRDPTWEKVTHAIIERILFTLHARGEWVAMVHASAHVSSSPSHLQGLAAETWVRKIRLIVE